MFFPFSHEQLSEACTPTSARTYLFAYSNDWVRVEFEYVLQALFRVGESDKYAWLANVRYDLRQPEDVGFYSNWGSWNSSVYARFPNTSLGFEDSQTGSDILTVLDKFLNHPLASCGPMIHVLLKRSPNEKDIKNLVAKVRQNNGVVRVIIPTNSSGGLYPETMYDLATKTNGLGMIALNYERSYIALQDICFIDYDPYQVYAVNVNVSGVGSMSLPDLSLPFGTYYNYLVTLQDNGVLSTFQSMNLTASNPYQTIRVSSVRDGGLMSDPGTNYRWEQHYTDGGNYAMKFDFNYTDSRVQTLQIRVTSISRTNYWIPYAD